MKSGSTDGQYSSVIRVLAVVAIAFMAVSAFASIPAEQTDADGKTVTVNSWDEFKDAVDAAGNGDTIVLGSDIKADDHDDVVIEDVSDLTIDLAGHLPGNTSRYSYTIGAALKLDDVVYYLITENVIDSAESSIKTGAFYLADVKTGDLFKAVRDDEEMTFTKGAAIKPEDYAVP
ncbi:MAG: hypothetical protein IJV47_07565, partial [Candidatus Methanomethylophilaceae archaeon]|nr:hypothetical protein [Candidatus Methanomethylophilaceae archaeon]